MSKKELIELAKSTTDPNVLEQLSFVLDNEVIRKVAKNKYCPLSALLRLYKKLGDSVKEHPNYIYCDVDELLSYVDHADYNLVEAVAAHPKCPPHVLEDPLSKDDYDGVRRAVAANPNCPPHVLEDRLSVDHNNVREGVAKNRKCPPHVLGKLSKDGVYYVRAAVAKNENCPEPILIELCNDSNKEVIEAVANNPRSFAIPQITEKLKAFNKKTVDEYSKTKIPKNLNAPPHLHKSINTDLELLLALHKYLTKNI